MTNINSDEVIYLLSNGSYSDYSIVGAYSTRELAEQAREYMKGTNKIETVPLNQFPSWPKNYKNWNVQVSQNGQILKIDSFEPSCLGKISAASRWFSRAHDQYSKPYNERDIILFVGCMTDTEEKAIKIAHDEWAQAKALNEFEKYEKQSKI